VHDETPPNSFAGFDEALIAAHAAEASITSSVECLDVWQRLTGRHLEIVGNFATECRAYLVMLARPNASAAPLAKRKIDVLERMLLGVDRKVISFDLHLSTSTVAQTLKEALGSIGLTCLPSRVPPLLVALVNCAHGVRSNHLFLSQFEHRNQSYVAMSSEIESDLWRELAPAQRAVLRARAYGKTYADIAAARHTSPRTVANQLAAARRTLGISTGIDILRMMAAVVGPPAAAVRT
jgi:DNA-binding NarL/FixJ family response regulator